MSNSEISLCTDLLLMESILGDSKFTKKAGVVSDLLDRMKEYFGEHIDKSKPTESVLNLLAPGTLWMVLRGVGLGKWGLLIGLLLEVFHVDVTGLISTLWTEVKTMLATHGKLSSEQIDGAVNSAIAAHNDPGSEEEAQQGYQALKQNPELAKGEEGLADDKVYSSAELLKETRMISLAMIAYEDQKMRLTKQADFFGSYNKSKAKGTSLLARILGFVFKVALASAGLMVAGDLINKFLGRPNAIDRTYQAGESETATAPVSVSHSTQTKFPFKGDAPLPRSWPLMNNPSNIESMLVQFAKDTYSGLDGKEGLITSSPAFQAIVQQIDWFNIHNKGSAAIFLPPSYSSKKQVVDSFIDDVAKAAG